MKEGLGSSVQQILGVYRLYRLYLKGVTALETGTMVYVIAREEPAISQ
jgi:hypothetical protein